MGQDVVYAVSKAVIGMGIRVFFREIRVRNAQRIPPQGPLLLVANHPNDKLDAFVIGYVMPRQVNFLAAGFLFRHKTLGWFLRRTGTIPVYRQHEDAEARERNVQSFAACFAVLEQGGAVGMFPEGVTHLDRQVKQIKSGAARLALAAAVRNQWQLGLQIVPVGLNYERPTRIRGQIFVNFGKPFAVADFRDDYARDPEAAVQRLTEVLYHKMQARVVPLGREDLQQLLHDLERIYKAHLVKQFAGTRPVSDFVLSQKLAEAVQYYYEHQPQKLAEVWGRLENYQRKLRQLGCGDTMVREYRHRGVLLRGLGALGMTVVGMPLAVYGWVNNAVAIGLTILCSQWQAEKITKLALRKILSGMLCFRSCTCCRPSSLAASFPSRSP